MFWALGDTDEADTFFASKGIPWVSGDKGLAIGQVTEPGQIRDTRREW